MRTIGYALALALVVTPFALPGVAAESTIVGTLVEVGCANMPASEGHAACMLRCAKRGEPIGIKTDDGIYTITGDWAANHGDALGELMATRVEARGEVDGMTIAAVSIVRAE